ETLAKLKVPVIHELRENLEGSMRLYTLWNDALSNEQTREEVKNRLVSELIDGNRTELETAVVSYILRYIGHLSKGEFVQILNRIERNGLKLSIKSSLFATLLISSPEEVGIESLDSIKTELISSQSSP